jgi:glycosyltransferase involved in cell wall biosynthesis
MKTINIVVAVRNEESAIIPFVESIRKIKIQDVLIRMIFVEDGSSDNTVLLLRELSHSSIDISYYSLFNPVGPGLATTYGILKSSGDAVIMMDVDGSHPVEMVNKMIEKFNEGFDIVQGRRISYYRKELYRRIGSKIYFILFSVFTGVNLYKQNVYFRLMSRKAIDFFCASPKMWLSVRLKNIHREIYNICYINFEAPERNEGKSKFNLKRLVSFAYMSFLTLTDVPMFIILSIIVLGVSTVIWYFIFKVLALIIFILSVLNISFYIYANRVDYLKRIILLESYNYNEQKHNNQ